MEPAMVLRIDYGEAGTAATLAAMAAYCLAPETVAALRPLALRITARAHSREDEAKAIYRWVRTRVRYVRDPAGLEHVSDPVEVARKAEAGSVLAAEDCDGHATLVGALCTCVGLPVRFVVTEDPSNVSTEERPWWAHVHAEAELEQGWCPLDSALSFVPLGSRVRGRRTYLDLADMPSEVLEDAGQGSQNRLGFIASVVQSSSQLVQSLIGARTQAKLADAQADAERAWAAAQSRYAEVEAGYLSAERQLEAEREARANQEAEALSAARSAAWFDTVFNLALIGAGGAAVWALNR